MYTFNMIPIKAPAKFSKDIKKHFKKTWAAKATQGEKHKSYYFIFYYKVKVVKVKCTSTTASWV